MPDPRKVLFICIHNSARSQMAEAFLNRHGAGRFQASSAGLEPTAINPDIVRVMAEIGIDLSGKATQSVFDLYRAGALFDHVITVCDESTERQCPIFPGVASRLHWPFPDPSSFTGPDEERLAKVRNLRDAIEARVKAWLADRK